MRKIKTLIISILVLGASASFSANDVVYCPISKTYFECVDQDNGLFSLEGHFKYDGHSFSLTLRRASEKDLCFSTINLFRSVVRDGYFCINGEIIKEYPFDITLNSVSSGNEIVWKYFK